MDVPSALLKVCQALNQNMANLDPDTQEQLRALLQPESRRVNQENFEWKLGLYASLAPILRHIPSRQLSAGLPGLMTLTRSRAKWGNVCLKLNLKPVFG
jgi:hypothetical protein